MPSDEQRSALEGLMKYRPSSYLENPHSYSSRSFPHFEPHITLTSVFLPTQPSLNTLLPPNLDYESITAKFESLHVGHKYRTSLSVTLEQTPDLMTLRDDIDAHVKLNDIENCSGRSPHMSLFYLDEANPGDRQALKEELQEEGLVEDTGEGLLLNPIGAAELTVGEIWLMDCTGEVAEWKFLERRDLALLNRRKAMLGRRSFSLPIPRAVQESLRRVILQTQLPSPMFQGPELHDEICIPAYPNPTPLSLPPSRWNVSHRDGHTQSLPTDSTSPEGYLSMAMPQVGEESPWLPSAEDSNEYPQEWGSRVSSESFDPRRPPVPRAFARRPVVYAEPLPHPSLHPAGTAKQNRDDPPRFCSTASEEPDTFHLDSPDLTPAAHAPRSMPRRVRKVPSFETVSSSTSNNTDGESTTDSLQSGGRMHQNDFPVLNALTVEELTLIGGTGGNGGPATGGGGTGSGGNGGIGQVARIVGRARHVHIHIYRTCSHDSYFEGY